VIEVEDLRRGERLPPTEGIVLRAEGIRLVVRPSGTEPKLKCYAEAVVPVAGEGPRDLAAARAEGAASVATLLAAAVGLVT
jgi:phosphomannomutase